jgi:hypothetical protein
MNIWQIIEGLNNLSDEQYETVVSLLNNQKKNIFLNEMVKCEMLSFYDDLDIHRFTIDSIESVLEQNAYDQAFTEATNFINSLTSLEHFYPREPLDNQIHYELCTVNQIPLNVIEIFNHSCELACRSVIEINNMVLYLSYARISNWYLGDNITGGIVGEKYILISKLNEFKYSLNFWSNSNDLQRIPANKNYFFNVVENLNTIFSKTVAYVQSLNTVEIERLNRYRCDANYEPFGTSFLDVTNRVLTESNTVEETTDIVSSSCMEPFFFNLQPFFFNFIFLILFISLIFFISKILLKKKKCIKI